MDVKKHFYMIHYWYENVSHPMDKDVFYGLEEDMEYLIYHMMESSPYKIDFVDINGIENYNYHRIISFPKDGSIKWTWDRN